MHKGLEKKGIERDRIQEKENSKKERKNGKWNGMEYIELKWKNRIQERKKWQLIIMQWRKLETKQNKNT